TTITALPTINSTRASNHSTNLTTRIWNTSNGYAVTKKPLQTCGVNLKDREQFTKEIIPTFAYNSTVIDFFLSSVVFPKEAKQFPHKLTTSGWDLAEVKSHVTTGFSGTNDNRYLLPTSIAHFDPVKRSSTNALILTYLLQPENNKYLRISGTNSDTCSAQEFLDLRVKQDPEIRVLLDVGAQMLGLKNDELVTYWLQLRPDVAAGVYFNDKDELVIHPQNGLPIPFSPSPLAQQMDKCIVYLDDGHTRGTNLKLPRGTRAAVTLGPKVTKDRMPQGMPWCMRMRKLGHGQSVMFCAPTEIDTQIRKAARLPSEDQIHTSHALRWAMLGTCKDLEHHISHWAQQGVEYNRRADAQNSFSQTGYIETLKNSWVAAESRSLQEMSPNVGNPSMDEEQEREVSHKVEREQQIERPQKFEPATHKVHEDVLHFVNTGSLPAHPIGIVSLFHPLRSSDLAQSSPGSSKLQAGVDFCRTLKTSVDVQVCEYMRPVNWVLSGPDGTLMALSPYGVDQLLPAIRKSVFVRLHVFAPRVTRSTISFSDLRFYSMPDSSISPPDMLVQLQLRLFAGQVYFDSYSQYRAVCAFLGIFVAPDSDQAAILVQSDGFVKESD
ncbi:hypothetical protein FRC10_004049, partial [Ceratobasidium sp. 414]